MSALTSKETEVKVYLETYFIPTLHRILESSNPEAYRQWGGNACRQTAILGAKLLEKLLPNYKWSVWEGEFSDIVRGRSVSYDHAWIYGVDSKHARRLLVDLSRNHHERLFMSVPSNAYPKNHPSYEHMVEIERRRLLVDICLNEREFYTQLTGYDLLGKIVQTLPEFGI